MSCLLDTESAQADLDQIWLFIARDNPGAADQFLNRLISRCHRTRPNDYSGNGDQKWDRVFAVSVSVSTLSFTSRWPTEYRRLA